MIFGLKRESMHAVLSDIAHEIKNGRKFEEDIKYNGVLFGDYAVYFKPVKEEFHLEYAGIATRYYKKPIHVLVMFWPDLENNKYSELVQDVESGEIIHSKKEPLSQHQVYGSAKFKKSE